MAATNGYEGAKPHLYKTRAGFGVWRWIHVRVCPRCKAEHRILGNNSTMRPNLPPGAIKCSTAGCDGLIPLGRAT